jgi:glucosyl-dolichyl phosphate glucuronosyltransferase
MSTSSRDVSVIICAYTENRWTELDAAVASLQGQTVPPREIVIVVDHNPTLLDRARRHFTTAVVVENHEPRGLGGARNSGSKAAQGAIIAFLDDDAVAALDWLEKLLAAYDDASVMGVGGATEPLWQGGRPDWFPEEFGWVVGCSYRGQPESLAPVRNLHGCNMSFRRELFSAVGDFRLGYGCDETEFCIRLQRHMPGKKLIYQPAARIRHQVPPARGTWRYFLSRCYFEGGSKAVVTWLVGSQTGLASERAFVFHTLPRGVMSGLRDAFLRGQVAGLARAAAITAGLASTTLGYLVGKLTTKHAARQRGWQCQVQEGAAG